MIKGAVVVYSAITVASPAIVPPVLWKEAVPPSKVETPSKIGWLGSLIVPIPKLVPLDCPESEYNSYAVNPPVIDTLGVNVASTTAPPPSIYCAKMSPNPIGSATPESVNTNTASYDWSSARVGVPAPVKKVSAATRPVPSSFASTSSIQEASPGAAATSTEGTSAPRVSSTPWLFWMPTGKSFELSVVPVPWEKPTALVKSAEKITLFKVIFFIIVLLLL